MAEPKKGKALLMMFGKPKGDGEPDGDGAPMGGDGNYDDFRAACDEMFDCIGKGDKAGFCEAFKSALDIDEASEGEGGEPEPEEGGEAA